VSQAEVDVAPEVVVEVDGAAAAVAEVDGVVAEEVVGKDLDRVAAEDVAAVAVLNSTTSRSKLQSTREI